MEIESIFLRICCCSSWKLLALSLYACEHEVRVWCVRIVSVGIKFTIDARHDETFRFFSSDICLKFTSAQGRKVCPLRLWKFINLRFFVYFAALLFFSLHWAYSSSTGFLSNLFLSFYLHGEYFRYCPVRTTYILVTPRIVVLLPPLLR